MELLGQRAKTWLTSGVPPNLNKITVLFYFCAVVSQHGIYAQTSLFHDAAGESAYKTFGNLISINTGDQSINFSSDLRFRKGGSKFNRIGFTTKINANEGIASLLSDQKLLLDGEIGLYLGRKKTSVLDREALSRPGWVREKYVSASALLDQNSIFDKGKVMNEVVYKRASGGWKIETGYFGYYSDILWGGAVNFGQKTNSGELTAYTILTKLSASGDTTLVYKQRQAFNPDDLKYAQWSLNLSGDVVMVIKKPSKEVGGVLAGIHFRYQALESTRHKFSPMAGIYLSKAKSPRDIVLGLQLQFHDIFNWNNEQTTTLQRVGVNFTAGYTVEGK